jgi:hypothetical protein
MEKYESLDAALKDLRLCYSWLAALIADIENCASNGTERKKQSGLRICNHTLSCFEKLLDSVSDKFEQENTMEGGGVQ